MEYQYLLIAVIFSFILGRFILKKIKFIYQNNDKKKTSLPKGEITAPDAPWLDKK